MNALEQIIKMQIEQNGPMRLSDFMALALSHPEHGYYMTRDPFGTQGDFTTAPEISQMFGEVIGAWFIDLWQKMGAPSSFIFLECGPGRGTLMADMLRVGQSSGFTRSAQIHLLETSPTLKKLQAETLKNYAPTWHEDLSTLPKGSPIFIIGNEFFDALPVQQFIFQDGTWRERVVGVEDNAFILGASDTVQDDLPKGTHNDIYEVSQISQNIMAQLTQRIVVQGGAGLFIDYGYEGGSKGDTVQAVQNHEYADLLKNVGQVDITAHVDFAALVKVVNTEGAQTYGPTPQGRFLKNLGIGYRKEALLQKADDKQRVDIETAFNRLTSIKDMGQLFKVLAVTNERVVPEGYS